MPILGIVDSSKRVSIDTGAMFPLQVITVGASGASSITFSNIPTTYTHLQIRAILKTTTNSNSDGNATWRVGNGTVDTGSNYASHDMRGSGSSVSSYGAANLTSMSFGFATGTNANNTSTFTGYTIDILDYANTNKFKTIRHFEGYYLNGVEGSVWLRSNLWRSTQAINIITFSGTTFTQYAQMALYGIKSA